MSKKEQQVWTYLLANRNAEFAEVAEACDVDEEFVKHLVNRIGSANWREEVSARQVGGDHYAKHTIQPWDIIDEYGLNFYEGNVLKYLLRRKGNRVEDLKKLIHYAEKELSNQGK